MLGELQRIDAYKRLNPNELTSIQLQDLEKEIKSKKSNIISDEYVDFRLWMLGLPSRQESFAEFLIKKIPKDTQLKILEVGCGRTGRLSRILAEKGFDITGIDPKVEITSDSNAKFIKKDLIIKNLIFHNIIL